MKKALHYKDICLLPCYSEIKTRKDADASVDFLGFKFKLPIIPSNMVCVVDEERAEWLSEYDYFYIMHRFGIDNYEFVKKSQGWKLSSISVGVQDSDMQSLEKMKQNKVYPDFITIDIAHGNSILMKNMIQFIKTLNLPSKIIAGNVCGVDGYKNLKNWGADAVKVGIGGGSACSTKNKTGFTMPMYSAIKQISKSEHYDPEVPIIADGGVREHADIVKAIHAGANMVMAGGIFSRCIDSPAEVVDGHKVYFGSASQYNKGEYRNVEGIKKTLNLDTMTYSDKLLEIEQDLQSAISYAGGKSLKDIRKAKSIRVTHWEA
jgi:GMP reductase